MKRLLFVIITVFTLISCKESTVQNIVKEVSPREAIIDNMLTRRAIRKYTEQQVSKDQLDTILKCAIYAPSGLNKQPWQIRVVQNQELLKEINQRFLNFAEGKEFKGSAAHYKEPGFSIFHNSPTLIVIARDVSNNGSTLDCGILLQNILLSAHALGLGTCPIGSLVHILNLPENHDILERLDIPEGYEVSINASLGYPDEKPAVKKRYEDRVKYID